MAEEQQRPEAENEASTRSGGVDIDAEHLHISGDVVGRDKIVGYTVEQASTFRTQISTTFQPRPFDGRSPYLGLDAFTEDDADRFFGRESLVEDLLDRVKGSLVVCDAHTARADSRRRSVSS